MKGARALASGMLVLLATCSVPAISAAQDAGTTTGTTTKTTPAAPPASPTSSPPTDPAAEGPAPGAPTEPRDESGGGGSAIGDTSLAGASTAGAPNPSTAKARKSASARVTMGDLFFSPASVTIAVGDSVTWRNAGQAPHNATADDGSFKTPDLDNGQSASHTFSQAGSFSYVCTIHPSMTGTVRVLASGGGGGGGAGGNGGRASSSSSNPGSSSSSEASAVASPNAAGDANTLPMTGMAVGALALAGVALLALGLLARLADRERSRLRWFSIF